MKIWMLLFPFMLLSGCSYLTDFLLKQDEGISVDAQIGSNENKVKTGVGSIGLDTDQQLTVEDSQNVQVNNTNDKYHISTEGTVNVYETNYWLYAIFGLFLVGKPALTRFWAAWDKRKARKQPQLDSHEYCTYTTLRRDSSVERSSSENS